MKTLCLTLALLLLAACCIDAQLAALQFSTAPQNCCFRFNTKTLRQNLVSDVTKSHRLCPNEALIVKTVKGKKFCYSHTSQWAKKLYNRFHSAEGSGLKA